MSSFFMEQNSNHHLKIKEVITFCYCVKMTDEMAQRFQKQTIFSKIMRATISNLFDRTGSPL